MAVITIMIISSLVGYNYSIEQKKQLGLVFGNELVIIQDNLQNYQSGFSSATNQFEEGQLSKIKLEDFAKKHFKKMDDLILQYDDLLPPESFTASVDIYKLSAESQLQSDKEYILWLQTDVKTHQIRASELFQEAFRYDTLALGEFNRAKLGNTVR